MKLKLGDQITYEFDNKIIIEGIIYDIGCAEDNESNHYWWFSKDGHKDTFNLDDPDDKWRVKSLNKNIFKE